MAQRAQQSRPSSRSANEGSPAVRTFPGFLVADAAYLVALAITLTCYFVTSRGFVINGDDWLTLLHGGSAGDYFRPYGDCLSVVPIGVYQLVFNLIGLGPYWILRLINVVCHGAISGALFLVVRSRVGSALALVAGVPVLWYPSALLIPALFNHWIATVACVFLLPALTRDGRRVDIAIGVALIIAFCASPIGVPAAAACLVYIAITRAPWSRWIAVLVPTTSWVIWWLIFELGHQNQNVGKGSLSYNVHYVLNGISGSFQLLAADNHWFGGLLATLFAATIAWRARKGARVAVNALAWTFAIVVWWVGLAYTRGLLGPDQFRYRLVTCVLAVLALLPTRRMSALNLRRATSPLAVGAALVLSATLVLVNGPSVFKQAHDLKPSYAVQKQKQIVANLGPAVVPDDLAIRFDIFTQMSARQYRGLVARYGAPEGSRPEHPDATLIALGQVSARAVSVPTSACVQLSGPAAVVPTPNLRPLSLNPKTKVLVHAVAREVVIRVRRFETSWVTIGRITQGATAEIDLPVLMSRRPWMILATGACQLAA